MEGAFSIRRGLTQDFDTTLWLVAKDEALPQLKQQLRLKPFGNSQTLCLLQVTRSHEMNCSLARRRPLAFGLVSFHRAQHEQGTAEVIGVLRLSLHPPNEDFCFLVLLVSESIEGHLEGDRIFCAYGKVSQITPHREDSADDKNGCCSYQGHPQTTSVRPLNERIDSSDG